jgi:tRNA(fMet)-specific endonuclease VapC
LIVLDTDALTLIQRRSGPQFESLASYLDAQGAEVFVTVISFEEQMRGWMAFISKAKSASAQVLPYQKLHSLLEDFQSRPILDFEERAVASLEQLRRAKIRVATMDMKIAAIVIANDATLVTLNRRDFARIPNLRLSDWRG